METVKHWQEILWFSWQVSGWGSPVSPSPSSLTLRYDPLWRFNISSSFNISSTLTKWKRKLSKKITPSSNFGFRKGYTSIMPLSRAYFTKIKRPGIGQFVKKHPFWKKSFFLNLSQKYQKQLPMRGVFDLHLPFSITQVPFCQTKFPFYWGEEPFSKINFIQFFHFKWIIS